MEVMFMNLCKKFLCAFVAGLSVSSMYAIQTADYGNEYGVDDLPQALQAASPVSSSRAPQSKFDSKKIRDVAAQMISSATDGTIIDKAISVADKIAHFSEKYSVFVNGGLCAALVTWKPMLAAILVSLNIAGRYKKHPGKIFAGSALGIVALVALKHFGWCLGDISWLGIFGGKIETTLMLSFLFIATYFGYKVKTGH
jgi:hypothetical protein